ncbi:hypothetical protein REH59_07455 [Pseudomonas sp. BO3-4]|uniref:hypothetical protein n=1 Tax=Pseudomonas sp. BO3-4 TaxID=3094916 RepID=UPI002A5A6449|nr:hypothetical protein [Pseudomonas sp. BO3-4]WPO31473.1 hypothetical protein REH59_07455 [Pseudomonas sp. BO3-4]
MFETHAEAISVSSELPNEQLLVIDYVSQRLQTAWFYITQHYMKSGSGDVSKGEVMIDDVDKLKRFFSKKFTGSYTYKIALVIPPVMSGTDDWSMAPLIEINEVVSAALAEKRHYIYTVDNEEGLYYSEKPDGTWERGPQVLIYKRNA